VEISSLCPFCVSTLVWEAQPSQFSLTVTVKATFRLVPGAEARVADVQEPLGADRHWDDRPMASLFAPADVVPSKRKIDVLVVGHAKAPAGVPVDSLIARFALGDVLDKSIRVSGDRLWQDDGRGALAPSRPSLFVAMPLRFERGPLSAENPVGIDASGPAIANAPAVPNLEPLDPETSAAFGPVASTWRERRTKVDDAGLFWAYGVASDSPARTGPPPPSFDFSFFNAAPLDQQLELVRPGTKIVLENMSAAHPLLESAVPSVRPQVFRIAPGSGRVEEITLRCDTLWIDADRELLVLTFRGVADAGAGDPEAIGSLVVVADPGGTKIRWDRVQKLMEADERSDTAPTPEPVVDDAKSADPLAVRYDAVLDEATKGRVPEVPSEPPPRSRPSGPPRPGPKTTPPPSMRTPPGARPGSIPMAAPLAPPLVAATPQLIVPLTPPPPHPGTEEESGPEKTQPLAIHTVPEMADEESTAVETAPNAEKPPLPSLPFVASSAPSPGGRTTAPMPVTTDGDLDEPTRAKRTDKPLPSFPGSRPSMDPADVGMFAAVSAHLARKGIERIAVLEAHGMTETEFSLLSERWKTSLESETDRGKKDLASAFDMAYVAAQERLDPPIGIAEYAQIVVALERGTVGRVLTELELELSDLMRLQRVWSRRVASSVEAQNSLNAAIEVMRRE
jgi:hypothetical protein